MRRRGGPRPSGWSGWRAAAIAAVAVSVVATTVVVAQRPPSVMASVDAASLAGDWYEVATTGTWWHRQCLADTRYGFDLPGPGGLRATSICSTRDGLARFRGRLRAARAGDGRLAIRFTPPIFNWLPATWSDFWILESGAGQGWLLVGDNRRERLLVLSRFVALDESAMAQAVAAARREGYDPGRLVRVPHPAGATGLLPRR
ncbi:lipocalin family protein [Luteitalea sp.]|uniref:lipocalin family protein n=1 Tax=Luteitalea sp. TaxID=2004800 RepID=UPI0025C0C967|nr:lipocalin family protein [Luteitalea sp.]